MSTTYQLTAYDLVSEALTIQVSMRYIEPDAVTNLPAPRTSFEVTWTEPRSTNAYDGVLVLVGSTPASISRRPNDGTRYSANSDLSIPNTPSIMIDGAQIVAAIYGDKVTRRIVVTGADPMAIYYVSLHVVTNILQYHGDGIRAYPLDSTQIKTDTAQIAGEIPFDDVPPTNLTVANRGQVYYNTIVSQVFMWTGSAWIPANSGSINSGSITKYVDSFGNTVLDTTVTPALNAPPVPGDFFYDTHLKRIFVWDGVKWDWANHQNENVPMVDKLGVGTDGSQDERSRLITILKTQLGYPTQCVELTEDAFNIAIDNALDEVRQLTDNAYTQAYLPMRIVPNQQSYILNDPRNDSNKIVSVSKIYRLSGYGGLVTTGDNGVYSQIFLQQMFNPAQIDLTSIHMAAQVQEEFQRLFAGDVTFSWNENRRELTLFRRLSSNERVLLECVMERTEQDLLLDRYLKQWIQGWAMAECLETLSYIRGKFASLPGAGGGISLNGSELGSQAETMFTELRRQINDYEIGNYAGTHGNASFLCG